MPEIMKSSQEAPKDVLSQKKWVEQKKVTTETKEKGDSLQKLVKVGFVIDRLNASDPEAKKEAKLIVKNALIKVNVFMNIYSNSLFNDLKKISAIKENSFMDNIYKTGFLGGMKKNFAIGEGMSFAGNETQENKVFEEAKTKEYKEFNASIKKNPGEFTQTDMENILVGVLLDMGWTTAFDKDIQEKIATVATTEKVPEDVFKAVFAKCATFYAIEKGNN